MKKSILVSCIALIGLGIYGTSHMSVVKNKDEVKIVHEEDRPKHIKWREGFAKTEGMIYVPDTYEVAYNTLVDLYSELKQTEGLQTNVDDLIWKEDNLIKHIKEQNNIVPQDYPPGTMLSPFVNLNEKYFNNIIFIPNKSLIDYKSEKNGLTKNQLESITNQIDSYEEESKKADSKLIEVMEVDCSINQLPRSIHLFYYPTAVTRLWQPSMNVDADNQTLQVLNNGTYEGFTYIFEKNGKVSVIHNDMDEEKRQVIDRDISIEDIEKVVYLFFLYDFIPEDPLDPFTDGTSFYWPKIVVYNIK